MMTPVPIESRQGEVRAMLTVVQVAEQLGVGQGMVYSLVDSGKLRCHRIGRRTIRISPEQVAEYLASVESRPSAMASTTPPATPKLKLRHLRA